MDKLWTPEFEAHAVEAQSFRELGKIGEAVLELTLSVFHVEKVGTVCGPISTGGEGSIEANLRVFEATIARLMNELKVPLFNQLPFERHLLRIAMLQGDAYRWQALMEEFYFPLFESGRIAPFYFIHGWEGSQSARMEDAKAVSLGIERIRLRKGFHLPVAVTGPAL
jgi:hypothetical protein